MSAPVTDLKGIGEKTGKLFASCGVRTVEELLHYYPRAYDSYAAPCFVRDFREGGRFAVSCRLLRVPSLTHARRYAILSGEATDGTDVFRVQWFNQPYLKNTLYAGREYVLRGYVKKKGRSWLMEQPGIHTPEDYALLRGSLLPRYPLVKGLKNATVIKAMHAALERVSLLDDPVPERIVGAHDLMPLSEALRILHFPSDDEAQARARRRLAFDEFFFFLLGIRSLKAAAAAEEDGIRMERTDPVDSFLGRLPFPLTGAQKRVLAEITADMTGGGVMHRLVQGDVGSGKTILALIAMLIAVENGHQAALMAPTQVLAAQHYETFARMTEQYDLPFRPVLLSGTCSAGERRQALSRIASGNVNCVIGTNALMQDAVQYRSLGLVITDEQHRFGVRQREYLARKGEKPHVLVMSATPIPRTLAMILYGDLQVSLVDELPAGRKKIKNALVGPEYRPKAWAFIAKQAAAGRQAYVICPMIEEGELAGAENVLDYAVKLSEAMPESVRVDILHGQMRAEDKDRAMERFARHETDVLVSTTVVEVGVNVPNATVMMIENAERFGIAQLHQLRGRVGRGEEQSYCIFVNTSEAEEAGKRMEILTKTNDGFRIADEDLKQRGPGDLFGVRQSGELAFRAADIYADADLLRLASADVDAIFAEDPSLSADRHAPLREAVEKCAFPDPATL
ncbi:MAG: ATP-dependent DNA helicase RecG [Lachnospiraceae bacterium]|nr:ATP-dependent DNA helicase RecG [Lachnospiraceae bacterium]